MIKTVSYSKSWLKLHWVRNLASLSSLYGAVLPAAPLGSPLLHPPLLDVAHFIKFILQIWVAAILLFQFKQQTSGFGYPGKDNCRGRDLVLLLRLAQTQIIVYRHLVVSYYITVWITTQKFQLQHCNCVYSISAGRPFCADKSKNGYETEQRCFCFIIL